MTYTHRNRIDGSRCAIQTRRIDGAVVIQVEGSPCQQTLAPVVFRHRWVRVEPVSGNCPCGGRAVEVVEGVAVCAECAEIQRRAA